MADIVYRSDMDVELVDSMGNDSSVIKAAKVSTLGSKDVTDMTREGQHRFIQFLVENRHGSPFEHVTFTFRITAPIFVWREFMRHRMASYNEECLAGSTRVVRMSPNQGTMHRKNSTIEVLYRNWHEGVPDTLGRNRILSSCRNIYVRSFDEETLEPRMSKVRDIVKKGVQRTYLVTLSSGHSIRSTMNHLYFTPGGWKRLSELKPGSIVYRTGKVAKDKSEPYIPPRTRQGIQVWTTQQKSIVVPAFGAECYVCHDELTYAEAQVDHIVPVVLDIAKGLDITNLAPICKHCHRQKTSTEQQYARRGTVSSVRGEMIESISDPREEMTYDLVLDDPHHNFVAAEQDCGLEGGFVVHNSGRYKQLEPVFYVPDASRNLIQVGKAGEYSFQAGSANQYEFTTVHLKNAARRAYESYEAMLRMGIAREVARMCLPVNIYSTAYVTMNLRALTNFLSLRVKDGTSMFPSFPQREIEMVAERMEALVEEVVPITFSLFHSSGRVPL